MAVGGIRELAVKAETTADAAQARQVAVEFLLSELDVAETLISVAKTTSQSETALRNLKNAWLALEAAEKFAKRLEPDFPSRRAFRDKYVDLCRRLTSLRIRLQL